MHPRTAEVRDEFCNNPERPPEHPDANSSLEDEECEDEECGDEGDDWMPTLDWSLLLGDEETSGPYHTSTLNEVFYYLLFNATPDRFKQHETKKKKPSDKTADAGTTWKDSRTMRTRSPSSISCAGRRANNAS
jgi:hypothetical protein